MTTSTATQRTGTGGSTPAEPGRPYPGGRLIGLDLARLLAIFGMISEHLLLGSGPAAVNVIVTGFPSTLFAVLGGVSAVLSTRRYLDARQPSAAVLSLISRGVVIAALGVALGFTPSFVTVVLVYYGATLIVTALLFRLPSLVILALVLVLAVGGPQLSVWVFEVSQLSTIGELSYADPAAFLRSILFTGTYPLIVWLAYMLAGVLVGRLLTGAGTRSPSLVTLGSTGLGLLVAAVVADLASRPAVIAALVDRGVPEASAVVVATEQGFGSPIGGGWIAVVNAAPHSGSTGDIVRTLGAAMLVIALLHAATARLRAVPVLLRPLQRAGAAPLTIYAIHVLAVAVTVVLMMRSGDDFSAPPWWVAGGGALALHVIGVVAIGSILAILGRRGPLETLTSAIARAGARVGRVMDDALGGRGRLRQGR